MAVPKRRHRGVVLGSEGEEKQKEEQEEKEEEGFRERYTSTLAIAAISSPLAATSVATSKAPRPAATACLYLFPSQSKYFSEVMLECMVNRSHSPMIQRSDPDVLQ